MTVLAIQGGHLIDPAAGVDALKDILLKDGRVAEIAGPGKLKLPEGAEVLDAKGLTIAPGLVDIHVHLREPGQGHKETIATGTAAAAAGGFTSVAAMPNTTPVNDSPEVTRWMQSPERGASVRVFPIGAATRGSKGEVLNDYAALKSAGAVAVTDDGQPILKDSVMREVLAAAARVGLSVIQHAEDTRMTQGASMNLGPISFRLGLRGMPTEAESNLVERDIRLVTELRESRAHLHVAHTSTAAALAAVRQARRSGLRVTCEVAPHHFLLTEEHVGLYNTHAKMNPPLRSAADRDAMIEGILDGVVDAIATDHAPHHPASKDVEFDRAPFGITGFETALALGLSELVHPGRISLLRLVELFTSGPARVLGIERKITEGQAADLTIFSPEHSWTFRAADSPSKSRNTPFDGRTFRGAPMATIVAGRIVYKQ